MNQITMRLDYLSGNTGGNDHNIGIGQSLLKSIVVLGVAGHNYIVIPLSLIIVLLEYTLTRRSANMTNVGSYTFNDGNNIVESQIGNDRRLLQ